MTMELLISFFGLIIGLRGFYVNDWAQACYGLLMMIGLNVMGLHDRIDTLEAHALPSPTQEAPK